MHRLTVLRPYMLVALCLGMAFSFGGRVLAEEKAPPSKEQRALAWAKKVAESRDTREAFVRWNARGKDSKATVKAMITLPFKGKTTTEPQAVDLLSFVGRYDPLWDRKDKLNADQLELISERIKQLPPEAIKEWHKALNVIHKNGISEVWTIGLMATQDRMFSKKGFEPAESRRLLQRLQALPPDPIGCVADVLQRSRAHGAVAIVGEDAFFDADSKFQADVFEIAKKHLAQLPK